MNLLQESSQVKDLPISHASCQDPNIGIWIKNESLKYVHNLHSPQKVNRLCSVSSVGGKGLSVPSSMLCLPVCFTYCRCSSTGPFAHNAMLENVPTARHSTTTSPSQVLKDHRASNQDLQQ